MASEIRIKRSSVGGKIPLTTDLALGELAINTFDGKLYLKKDDGGETIVDITGGTSAGTAGIVPIRGVQEFSSTTVADITVDDARYLRRGVVETDTNLFDIAIWDQVAPVTVFSQVDSRENYYGDSHSVTGAGYSSITDETVLRPDAANNRATVSAAGGKDFRLSVATIGETLTGRPVHSNGYWVISSGTNVVRSTDLFDTYSLVASGVNGDIFGNENAIVKGNFAGAAQRSVDGGLTWTAIADIGSISHSFKTTTTWAVADGSSLLTSVDEGLTWTNQGAPNGVSASSMFSDDTYFYIKGNLTDPVELYRSTDGATWTATGVVLSKESVIFSPTNSRIVYSNGIFLYPENNQILYVSTDGVNWKDYFRNGSIFVTSVYPQVYPLPTGIGVHFYKEYTDILENLPYAGDTISGDFENDYNKKLQFVRIS